MKDKERGGENLRSVQIESGLLNLNWRSSKWGLLKKINTTRNRTKIDARDEEIIIHHMIDSFQLFKLVM